VGSRKMRISALQAGFHLSMVAAQTAPAFAPPEKTGFRPSNQSAGMPFRGKLYLMDLRQYNVFG
jgi:hypothetical protein